MIPVTYEPMEGVLVFVAGPCPWIGTYGDMISSDLHGDKNSPDGCCAPTRVIETPEDALGKKKNVSPETL
jgi:hypothetical protein